MLAAASYIPTGYHHLGHVYPRERVRALWWPPSRRVQRQQPHIPAPTIVLFTGGYFDDGRLKAPSRPTQFEAR